MDLFTRAANRLAAAAVIAAAVLPAAGRGETIRFSETIHPILANNCLVCHGPNIQQGGLRLDTRDGAMAGGTSGPAIVPGDPGGSLLVRLIRGGDPDRPMPLGMEALPTEQIAAIEEWIEQGAPWDTETPAGKYSVNHWSFKPPQRPETPAVEAGEWCANPIDAFVLGKLEAEGIEPSPPADRATLIRRVSLDLTGIPPAPAEVDAFVYSGDPGAYGTLVDRLLASPRYGERWGRHWLDAARYADSNGYSIDGPREIWKYRDWVIEAFNRDMPFDEFTIHQIAGDLIPDSNQQTLIATGFHRNTKINQEGGIDPEQFRVEAVIDRVNTTGSVFLGLTVACSQCHDHKYDPISQREYYQLFDFFNQDEEPVLPVPSPDEAKRLEAHETQMRLLRDELRAYTASLGEEYAGKDFETARDADAGYQQRKGAIDALAKRKPDVTTTMILRQRETPRQTHIHIQGDFTRPGEPVTAGVPAVLNALDTGNERATRLDLALWLVSRDNPLTARVTVNRVWQRYFGTGIVETENDFGARGAPPTHPGLLDWLAVEFMESGWSLKHLHRLIVTSSTYRQSSRARPDLADIDPYNRLLARQNRVRLDAEIIRDSALAVSGLLTEKTGGPPVYPPQPEGVTALGQVRREWRVSDGEDRYRRGLYTFFWRATPHPALMVFDAPDGNTACTRRNRSNIPLQALNLLNDEAFFECAAALAARALREIPPGDSNRARYLFRLALCRAPEEVELDPLLNLLEAQRESFANDPEGAERVARWVPGNEFENAELAAWTLAARVLLNVDEFITRE